MNIYIVLVEIYTEYGMSADIASNSRTYINSFVQPVFFRMQRRVARRLTGFHFKYIHKLY